MLYLLVLDEAGDEIVLLAVDRLGLVGPRPTRSASHASIASAERASYGTDLRLEPQGVPLVLPRVCHRILKADTEQPHLQGMAQLFVASRIRPDHPASCNGSLPVWINGMIAVIRAARRTIGQPDNSLTITVIRSVSTTCNIITVMMHCLFYKISDNDV